MKASLADNVICIAKRTGPICIDINFVLELSITPAS